MSEEYPSIEVDKVGNHWIDTSDKDFQPMISLYDRG